MTTLHGIPSVGEVADQLRLFDYRLSQLVGAEDAEAARGKWEAADAQGWSRWLLDMAALQNRYDSASSQARDVVAVTPDAVASATPAQGFWNDVMGAWGNTDWSAVSGANGPVAGPGSFDDLLKRLGASPAADMVPAFANDPTPKATDPDLAAYQAADDAVKAVQQAAAATKRGATSLLKSPWTWGVGALLAGLVLVAWKVR